jgi:hypothetical protein
MIGPKQDANADIDSSDWNDPEEYSNSKGGESPFTYNDNPSGQSGAFPNSDDQELPEKM